MPYSHSHGDGYQIRGGFPDIVIPRKLYSSLLILIPNNAFYFLLFHLHRSQMRLCHSFIYLVSSLPPVRDLGGLSVKYLRLIEERLAHAIVIHWGSVACLNEQEPSQGANFKHIVSLLCPYVKPLTEFYYAHKKKEMRKVGVK